ADPAGDDERNDWEQEEPESQHPGDREDVHVELRGDDVVAAANPADCVRGHGRNTQRGARGGVARTLKQVMLTVVAGDPAFDERPKREQREYQAQTTDARQE